MADNPPIPVTTQGGSAPITLSASNLPSGLTLNDNGDGTGEITGTLAAGSADSSPYTVTVTATDSGGATAETDFTFEVDTLGIQLSSGVDDYVIKWTTESIDPAEDGNFITSWAPVVDDVGVSFTSHSGSHLFTLADTDLGSNPTIKNVTGTGGAGFTWDNFDVGQSYTIVAHGYIEDQGGAVAGNMGIVVARDVPNSLIVTGSYADGFGTRYQFFANSNGNTSAGLQFDQTPPPYLYMAMQSEPTTTIGGNRLLTGEDAGMNVTSNYSSTTVSNFENASMTATRIQFLTGTPTTNKPRVALTDVIVWNRYLDNTELATVASDFETYYGLA